ncbi:MAG: ABC transporter permease [Thermomonas hydrothermalis]|uniref:ABC transporter permease n=1 Tax=Thermomonas hydrothermalis TaxID=213588 RepID=UPI00235201F4|nr:ABC transporter permease [Thermomonas hydrothermalis]MCL6620290.1 ABC transporter permease [Thermomonas hydrothermalis]
MRGGNRDRWQMVWLAWQLARRDWQGRYRGAQFGALWALLTPLLMLAVYLLALGPLLQGRWPGVQGWPALGLMLYSGLAVHGLFAECLARAPQLVAAQPGYVRRVRFPLALLAWPALLAALAQFAMQLLVLLLVLPFVHGMSLTLLALPVVLLPMVPLLLAVLWAGGALGVYLRDLGQLVAPVSTVTLFLSSALVPLHAVPLPWRWLFAINPLTPIIDQLRRVLFQGLWPQWPVLLGYLALALLLAIAARLLFNRLQPGFADVV